MRPNAYTLPLTNRLCGVAPGKASQYLVTIHLVPLSTGQPLCHIACSGAAASASAEFAKSSAIPRSGTCEHTPRATMPTCKTCNLQEQLCATLAQPLASAQRNAQHATQA